jgi:hypothetical protein
MNRSHWPLVPGRVPRGTRPTGRRAVVLLTCLVGSLTLACAQTDFTGPEQPALEASTISIAPGFVKCRPLAPASASKYVSPGVWDTLKVGPHKLIFKPGSLAQRTLITATFSSDSSRSVQFGPAGLQFKSGYAPTLQLSVGNCNYLPLTTNIVYADDNLVYVKEKLSSLLNLSLGIVSAPISHFSRYAVHY